jgi:hypothetical protein
MNKQLANRIHRLENWIAPPVPIDCTGAKDQLLAKLAEIRERCCSETDQDEAPHSIEQLKTALQDRLARYQDIRQRRIYHL